MALPLELAGVRRDEAYQRADAALARVGLANAEDKRPGAASPAAWRCGSRWPARWSPSPSLLLLDEPFAALDEITRRVLADDVLSLWAASKPAIVFVTHNVEEAAYMASRVVVMTAGPGRIAGDFAVAGPVPRPAQFRTEAAFRTTAEAVSAALAEGIAA